MKENKMDELDKIAGGIYIGCNTDIVNPVPNPVIDLRKASEYRRKVYKETGKYPSEKELERFIIK